MGLACTVCGTVFYSAAAVKPGDPCAAPDCPGSLGPRRRTQLAVVRTSQPEPQKK